MVGLGGRGVYGRWTIGYGRRVHKEDRKSEGRQCEKRKKPVASRRADREGGGKVNRQGKMGGDLEGKNFSPSST